MKFTDLTLLCLPTESIILDNLLTKLIFENCLMTKEEPIDTLLEGYAMNLRALEQRNMPYAKTLVLSCQSNLSTRLLAS